MPAPYSSLQSKAEAAMKARAETVSLVNRGNAAVYPGLGVSDLPLPRIECTAEQGDEDPQDTGNYWMDAMVTIYSDKDEPLDTHRNRVGYVFDSFNVDELADVLTAAQTDFTCMGIINRKLPAQRSEDRHLVTTFSFQMLCAPSDL